MEAEKGKEEDRDGCVHRVLPTIGDADGKLIDTGRVNHIAKVDDACDGVARGVDNNVVVIGIILGRLLRQVAQDGRHLRFVALEHLFMNIGGRCGEEGSLMGVACAVRSTDKGRHFYPVGQRLFLRRRDAFDKDSQVQQVCQIPQVSAMRSRVVEPEGMGGAGAHGLGRDIWRQREKEKMQVGPATHVRFKCLIHLADEAPKVSEQRLRMGHLAHEAPLDKGQQPHAMAHCDG